MSSQREKLRDVLLLHKGKHNKITSAEIANHLGIVEDDTHAQTRALILSVAEEYNIALAADTRGYYIITTDKEYEDYMYNLESRIQGINKRKNIITKNYKGENKWILQLKMKN